jgi:hypothetical protein
MLILHNITTSGPKFNKDSLRSVLDPDVALEQHRIIGGDDLERGPPAIGRPVGFNDDRASRSEDLGID